MKIANGSLVLGVLLCLGIPVSGYGQNAYVLTKLTPPGTFFSEAYAINNSSQVTLRACATASSPQSAYIYVGGGMWEIGDLPGGVGNFPVDINNSFQVTGSDSFPGDGSHDHSYLYSGGLLSDLGTLPGGYRTLAYGINDSAQIAGYVDFTNDTRHAFLYSGGLMSDLGTLGGTDSVAEGINNAGDVVGYSFTVSRDIIHACLWRGGNLTDLFGLTAGQAIEATAINNLGMIVGRSRQNHAFVYANGLFQDLGTLGGSFSSAYAVSDRGQVVGYASAADDLAHAFLYWPGIGMIDLNQTVPLSDGTTPGFLSLNTATGVNELGDIVGTGAYFDGSVQSTQAFMLTPVVPQAAAPLFNPPGGGPFTWQIWVEIASATNNATIRYTTDGSVPTATSGLIYSGPVNICSTTTLKAIACADGFAPSPVSTAIYTMDLPPVDAPVFSPGGGAYAGAQTISITNWGTTIRYTTDGSTPSRTAGTVWTGPIVISNSTLLQAIAISDAGAVSPVTSANYTILPPAAEPSLSLAGGVYDAQQSVSIGTTTSGATIRYTTDGSMPSETNGTVYCGTPVSIGGTTVLKAIAYQSGFSDSPVSGGRFTIRSSVATSLDVIHDFSTFNGGGANPYAGLVMGGDGNFYGATACGSSGNFGSVFQMTPEGAYSTLTPFDSSNGSCPQSALVQGSDGNFYGTTEWLGSAYAGSVFRVTPAGILTTLALFDANNGANPYGALIQGIDGNLYGTTQYGGSGNLGTVFVVTPTGAFTTLVSFGGDNGACPQGALVQGSDGNFYGTTDGGGINNNGTVFRMTPAGALTTLVVFDGTNGANPQAGLVQGSDGNFYGTTFIGGSSADGTIFRMTPAGALTTLVSFNGDNGAGPKAALIQGSDGNFYGTTWQGGSSNNGAVFMMTPDGILTTLLSFDGANGANPCAGVVQGDDGSLYGTTLNGGLSNGGVVFQLAVPPQAGAPVFSPAAGTYTGAQTVTISSATSGATIRYTTDGSTPSETNGIVFSGTPVTVGAATTLKAIAYELGYIDSTVTGGVYTINLPPAPPPVLSSAPGTYAGTQAVAITSATSGATIRYTTDGSTPSETNGSVYSGTPVSIGSTTVLKVIAYEAGFVDSPVAGGLYTINSAPAVSLNVLCDFVAADNGGLRPYTALLQTADGVFWGTTSGGGIENFGTVFKMTPAGALSTAALFGGDAGVWCYSNLIQGGDGNLYGTTLYGGSGFDGTVFQLTPAGTMTTVASFDGDNGTSPRAGLVLGSDGNFYGSTQIGGSNNSGTIFRLTPTGVLTTLVTFDADNGSDPMAALVQGSDGNFYGTTGGGGSGANGTVFMMTPAGALTTLVSFNGDNGANPQAALVQGSDGNFYGTTSFGGSSGNGTVFRMTPAGALTTLVSFNGDNGGVPEAGLLQGRDGNFYGTTIFGGTENAGTVFMMTPAGVETVLFSFNGANGSHPFAPLIQGIDGNFYGTTETGGASDSGVVFELIVPPAVAAPAFSPAAGTYTSVQAVAITSATGGATIRYTTDGSMPSETNSILYAGTPVSIGATATLKAIAYQPGSFDSAVTSGQYTINLPVAVAPVFSPAAGTYTSVQSVKITSATSGATIRYTTDGSTPSETSGTLYSGTAVSIGATTTLKAIAYKSGFIDSAVASGRYTINLSVAVAPVFSPAVGTYTSAQSVKITSTTSGATIRYTTDGSTPSETSGTLYSGTAVSIGATTTLKAVAYKSGFVDSAVTSGQYTINLPVTAAPVFSPAAGTYTSAQSVKITSTTSGAAIRYTTDGSTPSETKGTLYSGTAVSIGATTTLKAVAYKSGFVDSAVTSGQYTINLPVTAAPVFSPAAGTYQSTQTVKITSTISGATIRYTTDGSTPTSTHGTVYSGSLTINTTTHLLAIAYANGCIASPVVAADYVIVPLATPAIVPGGGTYHGTQMVTITSTDSSVTIRYTTDGSTPTSTHGTVYSGPVKISATTTLKAVAYKTGCLDSAVATAAFVIQAAQTLNLEAESLAYIPSGALALVITDSRASDGKWVELVADGTGDSISFTLHAVPAELYQLKLCWKADCDRGILSLKVDGTQLGSTVDQYCSSPSIQTTLFGSLYLSAGDHVVQLVVTGKNKAASGFKVSADKFTLVGQ